jgi:hypothetical protein
MCTTDVDCRCSEGVISGAKGLVAKRGDSSITCSTSESWHSL